VKQSFWILILFSLVVLPGSSPAMDCQLGEKYYHQAKSETDPMRRIEWLQRSVKLCPNFNAWYMLGLLYKQQGRTDEAIDAFIHARTTAGPSRAEALALARKGELLAQTGQLSQALRALELAKRFHPEPAPHWLEKSLKDTRIQSYRTVMPAGDIASFFESETKASKDGRFAIRSALNLPVQFEFDRADLNYLGMQQITELGGALTRPKISQWRFLLVGHTDKRGSMAYNQILSEKRANAVKIELERRFPSLIGKLETEGRGEVELLYDGESEEDHMLNRRVKVTLIH
jgi:outer membrane protein OmpA-like peptidoglycan-associated protein